MVLTDEERKEIQAMIFEEIEYILDYNDPRGDAIREGAKLEEFRLSLTNRIGDRRRELDIKKSL